MPDPNGKDTTQDVIRRAFLSGLLDAGEKKFEQQKKKYLEPSPNSMLAPFTAPLTDPVPGTPAVGTRPAAPPVRAGGRPAWTPQTDPTRLYLESTLNTAAEPIASGVGSAIEFEPDRPDQAREDAAYRRLLDLPDAIFAIIFNDINADPNFTDFNTRQAYYRRLAELRAQGRLVGQFNPRTGRFTYSSATPLDDAAFSIVSGLFGTPFDPFFNGPPNGFVEVPTSEPVLGPARGIIGGIIGGPDVPGAPLAGQPGPNDPPRAPSTTPLKPPPDPNDNRGNRPRVPGLPDDLFRVNPPDP